MSNDSRDLELKIIDLREKKILLPDFQRKFVWNDLEMQSRLAASVLTKLPLGTLLFFKSSNPSEYMCRMVGTNLPIPNEEIESSEVKFLLDGQQRMTVLTNLFSNTIFEMCDKIKDIADKSLYNRFFLEIPKYGMDYEDEDIFGAKTLHFPFNPAADPKFSSSQVLSYIHCERIKGRTSTEPYNYYYLDAIGDMSKLTGFCNAGDPHNKLLIPLFLLLGDTKAKRKVKDEIIPALANTNVDRIENAYSKFIDESNVESLIEVLSEFFEKNELDRFRIHENLDATKTDDLKKRIREALEEKGKDWANSMSEYLAKCLSNINLDEIIIPESDRARGIDIYENLNIGGVKLSVFELLIAKAAKTSSASLNGRIAKFITEPNIFKKYSTSPYICDLLQSSFDRRCNDFPNEYSASEDWGCSDDDKVYRETFMNVLSLVTNATKQGGLKSKVNLEWMKRKKILDLTSSEINDNCEAVCAAIDKACLFFKARCGVRTLKELNYALMLTVVSYVLYYDSEYTTKLKTVINILEAWYWMSVFSGKYDKDQNSTAQKDINFILKNIEEIVSGTPVDLSWTDERKSLILDNKGFSDMEFIINGNSNDESYPKGVLGRTVCQYFLSRGYADLSSSNPKMINAFCEGVEKLEVHHVIPLGASGTVKESTLNLRKDKSCFLNFPMNLLLISPEANKEISAKSLQEYVQALPPFAGLQNVGFSSVNISITATDDEKKKVLKDRFKSLQAYVTFEIQNLLCI